MITIQIQLAEYQSAFFQFGRNNKYSIREIQGWNRCIFSSDSEALWKGRLLTTTIASIQCKFAPILLVRVGLRMELKSRPQIVSQAGRLACLLQWMFQLTSGLLLSPIEEIHVGCFPGSWVVSACSFHTYVPRQWMSIRAVQWPRREFNTGNGCVKKLLTNWINHFNCYF
jgi:hypothetical protein